MRIVGVSDSKNQKDLVDIFKIIGRKTKKIFVKSDNSESTETLHNSTFGVIYANDSAKLELDKESPKFPVNSTIVREKHSFAMIEGETPELIIAMVKRQKGFNKKTGDWEYFTFNGADMKLQKRESVSSCSKCHAGAAKTDYVFRDFLK
jgi:hypothetical protein